MPKTVQNSYLVKRVTSCPDLQFIKILTHVYHVEIRQDIVMPGAYLLCQDWRHLGRTLEVQAHNLNAMI
jgi:hypothetical protein